MKNPLLKSVMYNLMFFSIPMLSRASRKFVRFNFIYNCEYRKSLWD